MTSTADDEKELVTSWDTPAYGDDRPEVGRAHHRVLYGVIVAAIITAIIATVILASLTTASGGDQPDPDFTPTPAAPTVTVMSTVVITETVAVS